MLKIYGYTLLAFLAATQLTACDITEEQKAKTAILRLGECQAVETLSYTHATLRASIDEPLMRDAVHWQHQLVMGRYPTASRLQLHAARDIALLEIEQTDLQGKKVNRILVWCLKSKHQIIELAARATDAKMVSALLCHTNGLGSSL